MVKRLRPELRKTVTFPPRLANHQNPVQPLAQKYFHCGVGQITFTTPRVSPGKRGVGHRHERGSRCGGRGSVGARGGCRAVFRERCAACRRTALKPAWHGASSLGRAAARLAKPGCVRQKRVVLASVADAKPPVAEAIQPGRFGFKPAATVTRRIRRRGDHAISRKAIARGMPECFR